MSELLEKVMLRVRALPEERQDEIAEIVLDLVDEPCALLTDEQVAEVELAQREIREGKIASKERVAALWRRAGL